jgi:DNA polymerase-4
LLSGSPAAIGAAIRARVRDEIGITASVGASTNRLVSKVASDAGKPDGLVVVEAGEEAAFLAPRAIRELPMVGPKTAAVLDRLGVKTIGDLAALAPGLLTQHFGPHGPELRERALGRYQMPIHAGRAEAKSISREMTFDQDEPAADRLRAILRGQAERVAADLSKQGKSARTVTLKLRFPPFETLTRAATTPGPVDLADEVFETAATLFEDAWAANGRRAVRLIGLGVTNLQERGRQLRLGESVDADRLADAVTGLRGRFGDRVVRRAAELGIPPRTASTPPPPGLDTDGRLHP